MKKHTKHAKMPQSIQAKVNKQAPVNAILQSYKDKTAQRQPVEEELFQGKFSTAQNGVEEEEPLQKEENNTGLPDNLKSGVEHLSGYCMDNVKVHYNSTQPATLQAHAYAQGTDIHIASGQEKHLPHEAWHVVQQKQGRVKPTMQLKGTVPVNDDTGLEKEADMMGGRAQNANQAKPTSFKTPKNSSKAYQRVRFSNSNSFHREHIASDQLPAGLAKEMVKYYRIDTDTQFMISLSPKNKAWVAKYSGIPGAPQYVGDLVWVEITKDDWEVIRQTADAASLNKLSRPKVEQLSEEHFQLQAELMKELDQKITGIDERERKHVYRLGTVEVSFPDGNLALSLTAPILVVPNGLAPGYGLIADNEGLQNAIKENIRHTLEQSGQLDYIQRNELVDDQWRVIVDVDFYYERPADAVGFHKDTIGRSLFVNLNFNNPDHELVGPEYILNPMVVEEHDSHIKPKLPVEFFSDLASERTRLPIPGQIEATRIPERGRVSFVDEMIHHTTPYRDHRGISNIQLDTFIRNGNERDLYKSVRTAYLFCTLVNKVSRALVPIEYLKEIELTEEQISFLCPNGKYASSQAMKSQVKGQKEYIQMQELVLKNPIVVNTVKLTRGATHYDKDELLQAGLDSNFVNELFAHYQKPNMDSVSLAGCEDHCDSSVESKPYPIKAPQQRKLTRRMSEMLLTHQLPPATDKKRQFLRTWVQAIPKNK
ncbi:DUF4157 domain-containing protein [Pedobacter sp. ASV28]|uniref:eCIS core domain-containing protein n=1 Tax=Pedobacter sp. ASV28 TaxID=2795123 RepID=UPI0018ED65A4|nr:DUF4157 domain-containing protein [Pedobacter sp. ASV28]